MARARLLGLVFVALALVVGSTQARAHDPQARAVGRAQAPVRFRTPFEKGLAPLGDGALIRLGGKAHVDARQYKDLSAATQHLLKRYPADRHFFIGLGRDPAPFIAFLQNLGGKQLAINFPASSNESDRATQAVLANYVRKLVPPEVLESGRTIVFIDATKSGRALDAYVPLIAPSLQGAKVIKAAFGVHRNGARNTTIYTRPGDKQVIDTTPFPEVNRFLGDPYEGVVSEFPRHGPGTHRIEVLDAPLAQFQQYREALLQRMKRDEGLRHFLETEGGPAFQDDGAAP